MSGFSNPSGQSGQSRLFVGNGASPEAWTFIANITNLELDEKISFKDTTAHQAAAPTGPVPATQLPTVSKSSAKATVEWVSDAAQHVAIRAAMRAGTLNAYALSYPDASKTYDVFDAYVGGVPLKLPATGTATSDLTFEINGPIGGGTGFAS